MRQETSCQNTYTLETMEDAVTDRVEDLCNEAVQDALAERRKK